MQNKKLLSVLLSLVLVCTCIAGMLILNVSGEGEAREAVPFAAANAGELEAVLDEIATAEFTAEQKAVISLSGNVEAWVDDNGLLFGFETKFDAGNNRLPIEFIPAEGLDAKSVAITFGTMPDNVACANSYTFKDIGFYAAGAANKFNFYAGSGEVVLKNVDLVAPAADPKTANVNFYADNFTVAAFAGWEAPAATIQTSLTLDTVDYSWSEATIPQEGQPGYTEAQVNGVGWTGATYVGAAETDAVKAENVAVTLKIVDSKITGVHGRPMDAVSPVASLDLIVDDTSLADEDGGTNDNTFTVINQFTGVGNSGVNDDGRINSDVPDFGNFNFTVTVNGGTFGAAGGLQINTNPNTDKEVAEVWDAVNHVTFFRNANYTGDLTITINNGKFEENVYCGWNDGEKGSITGKAEATVNGGTVVGDLCLPISHAGEAPTSPETIQNVSIINGGDLGAVYGGRGSSVSSYVTINGGEIDTYIGSWQTSGGNSESTIPYVVNKMTGGKITKTFLGTGGTTAGNTSNYHVGEVINEITGGEIATFYGCGNNNSIQNVTNNLTDVTVTTFIGSWAKSSGDNYYGSNIKGTLTNNIDKSVVGTGALYMVGGSMPGNVVASVGSTAGSIKKQGTLSLAYQGLNTVIGGTVDFTLIEVAFSSQHVDLVNATCEDNVTFKHLDGYTTSNLVTCNGDIKKDLTVEYNSFDFGTDGTNYRRAVITTTDIGGDLNVTYKNCEITGPAVDLVVSGQTGTDPATGKGSQAVPVAGVPQDGNVTVTLDGFTDEIGRYSGIRAAVGGTYHQIFKGTNNLKQNAFEINFPVGTLETTVSGTLKVNDVDYFANNPYYGHTGTAIVGNVINNVEGAALKKGFYGTGAAVINVDDNGYVIPNGDETLYTGSPVGWFEEVQVPAQPAAPEPDEPATVEEGTEGEDTTEPEAPATETKYIWHPGNVTNNLRSGTIGVTNNEARFMGTGDQVINKVTTNMYGGTITQPFGTDSSLTKSNGCYFGNYGPVLESVNNNIYGGTVSYNFFGSNGDLTCAVNTTLGAALYEGDEELATLNFKARAAFAGGNAGTYTFTDGVVSDWTKNADVSGETGPVKIRINLNTPVTGKSIAVCSLLYNKDIQNAESADYAVDVSVVDTNFNNHQYFQSSNAAATIRGNVRVNFENVNHTNTGGRTVGVLANVQGNVEYHLKGVTYTENTKPGTYITNVEGNVTASFKDITHPVETTKIFVTGVEGGVDVAVENFTTPETSIVRAALNVNGGPVKVLVDGFTGADLSPVACAEVKGEDEVYSILDADITVKNVNLTADVNMLEYVKVHDENGEKGNVVINVENATFAGKLYPVYANENHDISGALTINLTDVAVTNSYSGLNGSDGVGDLAGLYTVNATRVVHAKDNTGKTTFVDMSSGASCTGGLIGMYDTCEFYGYSEQLVNRGVTGTVRNEFKDCTFGGIYAEGSNTKLVQNSGEIYIYGNTVVGNGEQAYTLYLTRKSGGLTHVGAKYSEDGPVPVETTLTINENARVLGQATNTDAGGYVETNVKIYDVTVKGSGNFIPATDANTEEAGWQAPDDYKVKVALVGNLMIPDGENPQIYLNAAEDGALVSPAAGDPWVKDKVYVTVVGADADAIKAVMDKIGTANLLGSSGNGKKTDTTIIGAVVELTTDAPMISVALDERIYIKLWIPKANIDSYFASGCKNMQGLDMLDVGATLIENDEAGRPDRDLGWVSIDAAYVAENTVPYNDTDYVVVLLGSVAANDFNTKIEFFASQQTVLGILPGADNTMLTLADTGIEMYQGVAVWKNLFTALYNYGASACGVDVKAMDDFEIEDAATDPVAGAVKGETAQFTGVSLLMGDAIGYRFNGKLAEGASASEVIVKVGGVATNNYTMYVKEDGTFKIDVYVNFNSVNENLEFDVAVNDATVNVSSSLKGFSESIVTEEDARTLALAQLVQAVSNKLAQN